MALKTKAFLTVGAALAVLISHAAPAQDAAPAASQPGSSGDLDQILGGGSAAPAPAGPAAAPGDGAPAAAAPASAPAGNVPAAPASPLPDAGGSEPPELKPDPLYQGLYSTVLFQFDRVDGGNAMGNGIGGVLGLGYRRDEVAFEGRATFSAHSDGRTYDVGAFGLFFPFKRLPGLYAIGGVGYQFVDGYPNLTNNPTFGRTTLNGGAGYILPLHFHRYEFGIRGEVLYQYAKREKIEGYEAAPGTDLPIENSTHDILFHLGLQLPFGLQPPPPPEPAHEEVVPVAAPAAEPAPPPPPPPPPPCESSEGKPIQLDGCKQGDKLVLHGVNFEFNKDKLTVNARTILDQVSEALTAHPDIAVEIDGYTDGKGSASYNRKLSDRRAASVTKYLGTRGIAASRMSSKGFGMANPIASNDTDEGREQNRRVELQIVAAGAPEGAAPPPN